MVSPQNSDTGAGRSPTPFPPSDATAERLVLTLIFICEELHEFLKFMSGEM